MKLVCLRNPIAATEPEKNALYHWVNSWHLKRPTQQSQNIAFYMLLTQQRDNIQLFNPNTRIVYFLSLLAMCSTYFRYLNTAPTWRHQTHASFCRQNVHVSKLCFTDIKYLKHNVGISRAGSVLVSVPRWYRSQCFAAVIAERGF